MSLHNARAHLVGRFPTFPDSPDMARHARVQELPTRTWAVSPALVGTVAAAVTTAGLATAGVSHHVLPTAAKAGSGVTQARAITKANRAHKTHPPRDLSELEAERAAERVARGEARRLLEERIAQLERDAAKTAALAKARVAAAAREHFLWLQHTCGYAPQAQRHPDHSAAQLRNARTIIAVARSMHLPPRAAVIAIAAAEQGSKLNNMRGGDMDSAGLFQMRPSAGWGSYRQVTDPVYASRKFYRVLLQVPGWRHLTATRAAQAVEVSAFGWAYARWELSAHQLVSRSWHVPATELLCTPSRAAVRTEHHHHSAAHKHTSQHGHRTEHHHQREHSHKTAHHKATEHHMKPEHRAHVEHHKAEPHKATQHKAVAKHARTSAKSAHHRRGKHAR